MSKWPMVATLHKVEKVRWMMMIMSTILYIETCDKIGLKPYPFHLNQKSQSIKKKDYLDFLSKGQERQEAPRKETLLDDDHFKEWKFTVVDIAQFKQNK